MKQMCFFCILLILVFFSSAQTTSSLFDDWADDGGTIKLGDMKLDITWTGDSALIDMGDERIDIPLHECLRMKPFDICLNETRLMKNGKVVPDDINDPYVDTQMHFIITGLLADLSLDRNFEKTTVKINEPILVTVSIKNIGDNSATDVVYKDSYPSGMKISNAKGCSIFDTDVTWEGTLTKGSITKCEYQITALKKKTVTSKATLEYYDGMKDVKKTDSVGITIEELALDALLSMNKTKLTSGDIINLEMNLSNTKTDEIKVKKLKLNVPKSLRLLDKGELTTSLEWKGNIADEKVFHVIFKAYRTGDFKANMSVAYEILDVSQQIFQEQKYTIMPDVTMEAKLNADAAYTDKDNELSIELFNPGGPGLLNVKTTIDSDLPEFKQLTFEDERIGSRNIKTHQIKYTSNETGSYNFNVSVSWKNEVGEVFAQNIEKTITINQVNTQITKNTVINETTKSTQDSKESFFKLKQGPESLIGIYIILAVIFFAGLLLFIKFKVRI